MPDDRFPLLTRTISVTLPTSCDDDRANELLGIQVNVQIDYALRGLEANLAALAGTNPALLRLEVSK